MTLRHRHRWAYIDGHIRCVGMGCAAARGMTPSETQLICRFYDRSVMEKVAEMRARQPADVPRGTLMMPSLIREEERHASD